MAKEPSWNLVHSALVSALNNINTAATSAYWNTLRFVYDRQPSEWDPSRIPAVAVYPSNSQPARQYINQFRDVGVVMNFDVMAVLKDDGGSPHRAVHRLMADIHRALYANPNLGVQGVERFFFTSPPVLETGLLGSTEGTIGLRYSVSVKMFYVDDAP